MPGAHHYLVHGLLISSPVELPIPEAGPVAPSGSRGPDVFYAVASTEGRLPLTFDTRPGDDTRPGESWAREHWTDEGLVVEYPGAAMFRVDRETIMLLADDTDDDDYLAHLLLDDVLPKLVALRGDLMLHAAGVVGPSGLAHVFLGESGTGKSTLATALAGVGWPLLDDDGIRVVERRDAWQAVPGYAGLRLLPDSTLAAAPQLAPERPLAKDHPKFRYTVDGAFRMAPDLSPIGGIYLLQRRPVERVQLETVRFADAITALSEHGFHLAEEPEEITRQAFERAAAVAALVPVHRLSIPDGLDQLGRVLGALSDVDEHLS